MQKVEGGPDRGTARSRHIVRGLGSLTIQSVLSAVLGFVLFFSLVRFLPQSVYGAYAAVQVTVGIAGTFAGFGLSSAVVRYLAPDSSPQAGAGWGPAKAALILVATLSAGVSLVMAALAPYLSEYFSKSLASTWVFEFGVLWLFTSALAGPMQAVLQGMRRYSLLARVLLVTRFVAVAVAVLGVVLYQSLAIAVVSQGLYGALIFFSIFPVVLGPLRRADSRPYYPTVVSYAFPLGLAGLVSVVASNADIVVVGGYLNSGALAVYNATVTISGVLSAFFVTPLVTALFAETSLSSESAGELKLGANLSIRFMLMTLLPASLFAAALSTQLFDLFSGGGSYAQGIPYLQLITLMYVFTGVQSVVIYILQGVSKTRQVLMIGAVTAIGEIVLSASLVPSLGLAGAAYSRVAMFFVGCALSLYFIRVYLPRPFDYRFLGKALLASAIPAMAVYLPSVMISSRVLTIVPYTVLGLALFAVCAKALRLLNDEDKSYLGHLLPGGLQWVLRFL
ncbi:MAG: oligosaccharide flippase family protein [Nitrososphaerota archaeon]|nr:oligosaccharide flippase family protein [Nitrososphaerota archaeon]